MQIIHIASELAPCAKVGGLADVVLGLSRELQNQKHDVSVIIPKYDCLDLSTIEELEVAVKGLKSFDGNPDHQSTIWKGKVEDLTVYFVDPQHPAEHFSRDCFYGCEDDIERFTFFARSAVEYLVQTKQSPDVIHLHDWQTALIAPLIKEIYQKQGLDDSRIIFTIHNMEHQGWCMRQDLKKIGLPPDEFMTPEGLQDNVRFWDANLMKGGIVYADSVVTVSPTYATEVQSADQGRTLETTLTQFKDKFSGILNGLDDRFWNPMADRYLSNPFSIKDLKGKEKNKRELQERFSLAIEDKPIVATVSRLVPQKGVNMMGHAIARTAELGGQFILLGTSPIPSISREFSELKDLFTDHPHVHLELNHHEHLAHLIYAGADMLLVPSAFEPCGLTQLIAMKYGTVPIVRRTGGLADTVFDVDFSEKPYEERNGYSFDDLDANGVNSALDRAIKHYRDYPDIWKHMMEVGMKTSYDWKKPAKEYLKLYKKAKNKKKKVAVKK
ncbi:Glycogen synthase [Chlamydiales bacterium SCGC AG-110-M15]|nr:Glycogen synthase [Chlamydiales bacterium SCGC AG-110-M15]